MAATQDFHRKTQEEISMTREEFQKLTQDVVLLDGATGSNLMAAGMPRGICTEAWIMEHKEVLLNLQKSYVEAGSQIVYALSAETVTVSDFTDCRISLRK